MTSLFAPKEADEDLYIMTVAIAMITVVAMLAMLQISFYNGFRYALVEIEQIATDGTVNGIIEGGRKDRFRYIARFRYVDSRGNAHFGEKFLGHNYMEPPRIGTRYPIIYNPNLPRYYMFPEDLEDFKFDLRMSLGFFAVMVLAVIIAALTVMKYLKFRQKMYRY